MKTTEWFEVSFSDNMYTQPYTNCPRPKTAATFIKYFKSIENPSKTNQKLSSDQQKIAQKYLKSPQKT